MFTTHPLFLRIRHLRRSSHPKNNAAPKQIKRNLNKKETSPVVTMEESLILGVSGYPRLYDPSTDSYRDQVARDAAWKHISDEIKLPGMCFYCKIVCWYANSG